MSQNPARGGSEVVDNDVRRDIRERVAFGFRARAGAHQNRARARRPGQADIEPRIADDKRARWIQIEITDRLLDHPPRRFAALADPRIRCDRSGRMVRTIVIRVHLGASGSERPRHRCVNLRQPLFRQHSSGDSRLIRRDSDNQAGGVQRPDGVDRPREELDIVERVQISDVPNHRPVAIEEDRGFHNALRAADATADTSIRNMHRWSSGHSRSMQGRHQTGAVMMA